MKSLFKVTLLSATMAIALTAPQVMAAKSVSDADQHVAGFKDDSQKSAYALGASLGRYMDKSLKEQEKLGVSLDRSQMVAGVKDAFSGKSKLSEQQTDEILQALETRLKSAAEAKLKKDIEVNAKNGEAFAAKFASEPGVQKTGSGLLYRVTREGTGEAPKSSDTVVVNYKGTLIDGKEFDNSYTRGEPLSFRLDGVIPGWTEGLQHVKKGGAITLVIPPALAYGKQGVGGIPVNSTLVFDVELLDIKPESKAAEAAPVQGEVKKAAQ